MPVFDYGCMVKYLLGDVAFCESCPGESAVDRFIDSEEKKKRHVGWLDFPNAKANERALQSCWFPMRNILTIISVSLYSQM